MANVRAKLRQLMDERGWSEYRLSKESGLSESTLANIFHRNSIPSIPTLEVICDCFGISISQFFADDEMVELTPELKKLFEKWAMLTAEQKDVVIGMIDALNNAKTFK